MISIELEKKEFDTYLLVGHDRNMFFLNKVSRNDYNRIRKKMEYDI